MTDAVADAVQELTDIDGVERPDAEVIADVIIEDTTIEDWVDQAKEVEAEQAGKEALEALIASTVAEQLSRILAAQNPPPASKTMQSKVHDRFVGQGEAGTGPILKHYRCEAAHAVKVSELDMDLLEAYESGAKERPTNEKGKPYSPIELAVIPGKWIEFIEGHCYCRTDNQVRNIERIRERARQGLPGGMPGIYEDTGAVSENWQCFVCQHQPKFPNRETHDGHMWETHGVAPARAA